MEYMHPRGRGTRDRLKKTRVSAFSQVRAVSEDKKMTCPVVAPDFSLIQIKSKHCPRQSPPHVEDSVPA